MPGKHYPTNTGSHLHRVADLLSRHCTLPAKTTPDSEGPLAWGIIAQASSIGSMGKPFLSIYKCSIQKYANQSKIIFS